MSTVDGVGRTAPENLSKPPSGSVGMKVKESFNLAKPLCQETGG